MIQSTSYPKIFALGHRALAALFDGHIIIQEKYDGSQFTFFLDDEGRLRFRSKRTDLDPDETKGLFANSIQAVRAAHEEHGLDPELVYRGESISKPRHNVLTYGRTPKGHVVLFDCQRKDASEYYSDPALVRIKALCLGLEPARTLYEGPGDDFTKETIEKYMELESTLGGCKLEGIVIKNYGQFGPDKKALMGKCVRAEFKEKMQGRIKQSKVDTIEEVIARYRTEARWQKAFQHLREEGALICAPQDIPKLMKAVLQDVEEECADEIRDLLWKSFRKRILRGTTRGLPEWYKDKLLTMQFEEEGEDGS